MISPHAKQKIQAHVRAAVGGSQYLMPATEWQLSNFENTYGFIPKDYRWLLTTCGCARFGDLRVSDIAELEQIHEQLRTENLAQNCSDMRNVFVMGHDESGNPFGIENGSGRVLIEDLTLRTVHEVAPNFEEFALRGIWASVQPA